MTFTALRSIDWVLLAGALLLSAAGLVTVNSFIEPNTFFQQQLVWLCIALAVFFAASLVDWRFLRNTWVVVTLLFASLLSLLLLFAFGTVTLGALSRFNFGAFFIQPSDPAKIVLIILLAKYFSRRHVEIAHVRHILVSGLYAFLFFVLLFVQPDFGGAIVVFFIWLGMVLVSGISKKHLAIVFAIGALAFGGLWGFVFQDYQKARIRTFLNPVTDIQGAGYNAYQSTITVGSGQLLGKGIGFGTQSRLQFLPEYETDFVFGAFSEEWGFIGVLFLLLCFGVVVWRIMQEAFLGATNFETLFAVGVALSIVAPGLIHIGMNIGLLPVTGTVLPFVSYGGSHLVVEFLSLGILSGMRRYRRDVHRELVS
jgi:rod shape determining protein RodA